MGLKALITQWNSPVSWQNLQWWLHKQEFHSPKENSCYNLRSLEMAPFLLWASRLEYSPGTRRLQRFQTCTVTFFSSVHILISYAETRSLHPGILKVTSPCYWPKSTPFSETSAFKTFLKHCVPLRPRLSRGRFQYMSRYRAWMHMPLLWECGFLKWFGFFTNGKIFDMHQTLFWDYLKKAPKKWLLKYMAVTFLLPMLTFDN